MLKFRDTYLENRILNRNELIIQLNIKTSEAMWSSDWSCGKQYNKFCKQPRPKMQRYAFGDEKAIRASPSGHFEADASQCHLLRKCHEIRKNVLMKVNFQRLPPSVCNRSQKPSWLSPRPISNSQLHALLHFHLCPIYLVVFKGSYNLRWDISSWGGLHA